MPPELTRRERQILDFVRQFVEARGYPPSVREIGAAVGLRSTSTVHAYLSGLEEKGYLRRDPAKPRAIELVETRPYFTRKRMVSVPLVGRVTAGQPILAVENVEDYYLLPWDITRGEDVFLLEVRGDSMVEAGILHGDRVLVRRQDWADDGDIVVALLEDEATVKRFRRTPEGVKLEPAHPQMKPIFCREVRILGKVIGLFRRID